MENKALNMRLLCGSRIMELCVDNTYTNIPEVEVEVSHCMVVLVHGSTWWYHYMVVSRLKQGTHSTLF